MDERTEQIKLHGCHNHVGSNLEPHTVVIEWTLEKDLTTFCVILGNESG